MSGCGCAFGTQFGDSKRSSGGGSSVTPGYLSEGGLKLKVFFDDFSSLNKEMLEMQILKGVSLCSEYIICDDSSMDPRV